MNKPGNTVTGDQKGTNSPVKMFTQEQVNALMQKRVERSHNAFFRRYGVNNLEELDNLVGKANSYQPTKDLYDELQKNHEDLSTQHKDLTKRYAYKVGNINPDKYNDIETYFKGKGIDIDENTLGQELKTHADWINKTATITNIGSEAADPSSQNDAVLASQYLGVDVTD